MPARPARRRSSRKQKTIERPRSTDAGFSGVRLERVNTALKGTFRAASYRDSSHLSNTVAGSMSR